MDDVDVMTFQKFRESETARIRKHRPSIGTFSINAYIMLETTLGQVNRVDFAAHTWRKLIYFSHFAIAFRWSS